MRSYSAVSGSVVQTETAVLPLKVDFETEKISIL